MPNLSVKPVASRADQKLFFNLPWRLYADDPHWVPPLRGNQKELLGFKPHPFYDTNDGQAFLAVRDGQAVGRVMAIHNRGHIQYHNEEIGFFGFFESIDDQEVADGLFEAVRGWFVERGLTRIRGPVNPSLNYEVGLLIDGFDSPPTFMMTYNPPYYAELLERVGLRKEQDLYAFWGHVDMLEGLDKKMSFVVAESKRRFNLKLRRLDTRRFEEEVRMFLDIYNKSLGGTWGFVPMSEGEIAHMSKSLKHLIAPEMTSVCEVDGKPIAAVFALLDYNPRIKKIDGRLFPFGFLRLLWNRKRIDRVRLISTNVLPEYQRWGVGLVVTARLIPDVIEWGIKDAEFSWVLESNHLSFKTLKRGGAKISKTYRIYDWETAGRANGDEAARETETT